MSRPRSTTTSVVERVDDDAVGAGDQHAGLERRREAMVIDLVIVTPPKPPGSSTLISPPVAVFEIAPAKVLHGAVRLHGLASSPTPETQVRVACANAAELPGEDQDAEGKQTGDVDARAHSAFLLRNSVGSRIRSWLC